MAGEDARRILRRDSKVKLFEEIAFRSVTAKNRIMMSPMCQYSATDGLPNDWHLQHLGARAVGGAGIVCTEATHVEARGRITPWCLGLWNDAQRDAFRPIVDFLEAQGAVPAIQLAHAGRKASVSRPWEGTVAVPPENGGWQVIGPSEEAYAETYPSPREMTAEDIAEVLEAFRSATRRAREAGFKIIEIHGAHGYLIHSFLSPLSNRREDDYNGDLKARARFLMETIDAVRSEWPAEMPLFLRISSSDWVEGGWSLADSVELAKLIKARGDVDLIDCSSGGNDRRQAIPLHPGYQVRFAETIKREAGIATGAVGLINTPEMAEEILGNARADLIILGRILLAEPNWPLHAARALKAQNVAWPLQYERANIY